MIPYILLLTVALNLVAFAYLNVFHNAGINPFHSGYRATSIIGSILRSMVLIHLFGWVSGLILAALTLFDVITYAFCWIFMVPAAGAIIKAGRNGSVPHINPFFVGLWQVSLMVLPLLYISCAIILPFAPLKDYLDSTTQWLIFLGAIALGFCCKGLFENFYENYGE